MSASSDFAVVCWRWQPRPGYRSVFSVATVNTLRRMVARHFPVPHRFICVTDDPAGLDEAVEVVPLWPDFADVPNPAGAKYPSCYRRLRAFAPDIGDVFGPRFVSIDLDTVITGDLRPLWLRDEDFVCWGDRTHRTTPYNGSMFLLRAGTRARVWEEFDPSRSPQLASRAGFHGSDQGWISYCLGPHEARWTKADGVYCFRLDLRHSPRLPANTRVVFFNGSLDPWTVRSGAATAWLREHYR
jgi:hypothetical protein